MDATTFIIDGSNVAHSGQTHPSLGRLLAAVESLRQTHPDDEVVVMVDATLRHRLPKDEVAQHDALRGQGAISVAPAATRGAGDTVLLQAGLDRLAAGNQVVIVSNDLFKDHLDHHRWLLDEGRVLGGTFAGGRWTWAQRDLRLPVPRRSSRPKDAPAAPTTAVQQPLRAEDLVLDVSNPSAKPERELELSSMVAVGVRNSHQEIWRIKRGELHHRWSWGSWSDQWLVTPLPGGAQATSIAGCAHGETIDLWVTTEAGHLLHRWWTAADRWSDWEDWGEAQPPITATSAADNHMEVWAMREGRLQHRWYLDWWRDEWVDFDA